MDNEKQIERIAASKSPEEYIENSLDSGLPPRLKARAARIWMERTGCSSEDIVHARNRHPYWKAQKSKNAAERARRRMDANDFAGGKPSGWDSERLARFLELNGRDPDGRFLRKDRELAEAFRTTIPSIQYLRRKHAAILRSFGRDVPVDLAIDCMALAETVLKRGSRAIEEALSQRQRAQANGAGRREA
ncbi:MAG: hypothetical protein JXA15_03310 [Spirochaetales bacterium]|nr:hypothetical protein [Spirochaetales bacterium]